MGSWMNYSGPWPGEEWQTATRLLTEKRLQLAPLIAHRGDAESFARAVQAPQRRANARQNPAQTLLTARASHQRWLIQPFENYRSPFVTLRLHWR